MTYNPSIRRHANKIENKITFRRKTGHHLELLIPETRKLLGITKIKINKIKNGENVPHLEITEVVLIYCNIVKIDYQQNSRVLYIFVTTKSFGQLLDISPKKEKMFLKTFDSECWYMEVWFTDQNCKLIEIEDKINVTFVIS